MADHLDRFTPRPMRHTQEPTIPLDQLLPALQAAQEALLISRRNAYILEALVQALVARGLVDAEQILELAGEISTQAEQPSSITISDPDGLD